MEKLVQFNPAYDKRDPDPTKNYGIHGVNIRMVLKGERGAVQFLIFTSWQLPEVQRSLRKQGEPMAADFGYHSPVPMCENQHAITEECEYLDGKPCYYDGSSLYAEKVFERLLREGDEAVWKELEEYYIEKFGALE